MTVLADATPVSQRDGEAGSWEFCFEADAASVCDDDGQPRPEVDVVTWMKQHNYDLTYGTLVNWGIAYFQGHNIPCHYVTGNASIDQGLNQRKNLIWLVYTDGRGNINGSRHTRHYVRVWGHDAAGVHIMNSLGDPIFGQNHVIDDATFFGNSCGEGIQLDVVLLSDEGGRMFTDDQINAMFAQRDGYLNGLKKDVAGAVVTLVYLCLEGREPTYDEINYEVGQIMAGNIGIMAEAHNLADNDATLKKNVGKLQAFFAAA